MQESTAHKTARTSFWGAVERVSTLSVQFIITMILARLLSPSDYGIIAMLTIFIAISQQFVECGISNALIRKLDCTQSDYSTAFHFNVGISFLIYLLLFLSAPLVADFYDMPILTNVLRVYSLSIVFQSFRIVQYAILCKQFEFKKMAKVTALVTLLSGTIGVVMAYRGFGVWSLVAQNVFLAVSTSFAYFLVLRWLPSWEFSKNSFRYLWGFGSKMLVSGVISVIYTNIYSLVIGKVYDSRSLGIFNRAQQLSHIYPDIIKNIFTKNSLPIMAECQNEPEKLEKVYREFVVIVAFLTFPVVLLLLVIAKPFILFFLTAKWAESIIYLQIFCASALILPVNWINLNLLQALGRSDLTLKAEMIKKSVGLALVFSMFWFGPLVLAICCSVFDVFAYAVNLYYAKKLIGVSYLLQIKDMIPCLLSSLISACVAYLMMNLTDAYVQKMLIAVICGVAVYVFVTRNVFKMNIYTKIRRVTR